MGCVEKSEFVALAQEAFSKPVVEAAPEPEASPKPSAGGSKPGSPPPDIDIDAIMKKMEEDRKQKDQLRVLGGLPLLYARRTKSCSTPLTVSHCLAHTHTHTHAYTRMRETLRKAGIDTSGMNFGGMGDIDPSILENLRRSRGPPPPRKQKRRKKRPKRDEPEVDEEIEL